MPSNGDAGRYGRCYFQLDKCHGVMRKPTHRAAEAFFSSNVAIPLAQKIKAQGDRVKLGLFGALILFLICPQDLRRPAKAPTSSGGLRQTESEWVLKWSDEFNGPNGSPPDPAKWTLMSGGGGWGNNERQYYTDRWQNVRQEHGNLILEAVKEGFQGSDRIRREYTSARISTEGRFSQKYGRFEARIRVPKGNGLWSAFWLLGEDFSSNGWPACGEIDIMEHIGKEPATVLGSLHGPGYSGENSLTTAHAASQGELSDGFHVFAMEWESQAIRFYVDGILFATKTAGDVPAGKRWVFDHPFFVILNLAVGGNLPGDPDASTVFPQQMLVDYVRVYSRAQGPKSERRQSVSSSLRHGSEEEF
jgi:beta-glucanase (GH16 family)